MSEPMPAELRVRAVLFDMDGTLVDSNAIVEQIWTEFATSNGFDPAVVIAYAHGRPSTSTIAKYLDGDSVGIALWNARLHELEATAFGAVTPMPGAVEFAASLPRGAYAVVTSAVRDPARDRLEVCGFDVPDVLIGADDVAKGKPEPEGYLAAAHKLGVAPSECVVFEDTDAGVRAGLAAGALVVVVGYAETDATDGLHRVFGYEGLTVEVEPAADSSDDGAALGWLRISGF